MHSMVMQTVRKDNSVCVEHKRIINAISCSDIQEES